MLSASSAVAQLRQVLPRQREHARTVLALERELPAFERLDRVARAEHAQVRDRAQRREMLDRLVGRAVFAEPDRVVRHHVDHALAHQRGEPDRRAAVVGEHQERAGVGDDAAMQRHAVHRRRHAVLADAVMDEGAGIVGSRHRLHGLGARVVRAGEVGRAADHFRHRRGEHAERVFGCRARRDVLRLGGELFLGAAHRVGKRERQVAVDAARELAALLDRQRGEALVPGLVRGLRALAGGTPPIENVRGNFERRVRPAKLLARALDLVGAERRAVRGRLAGFRGRAEADGRLAGDHRRADRIFCAAAIAAAIACGSCPSMRHAFQPAASKRST